METSGQPDGQSGIAPRARHPWLLPVVLVGLFAACSPPNPSTPTLFADGEHRLALSDQRAIAAMFESMSADSPCGDVLPEAEVTDLNADGVQEVFVQWGNTCTSGMAGRSLTLFTKDGNGNYLSQFGFPALGWTRLDNVAHGWPDLSFGGPGFCHPVWTRNAVAYEFKCNLPETGGGCDSRGDIC